MSHSYSAKNRSKLGQSVRAGAAASECALVLPLILLIAFGTVEISVAMFLKETATIAAYEGARVAVQKGATADDVRERVMAVLNERGANLSALPNGDPLTISPSLDVPNLLEPIRITVQIPCKGNTVFPVGHIYGFMGNLSVYGNCVMLKEYRK